MADGYLRRPGIAAVAIVMISALAGRGLFRVTFDDSPHNIFKSDDAEFQFLKEVLQQYGADDNDCLLMVRADEIFSAEALHDLQNLRDRAGQVTGVEEVVSLVDPPAMRLLGLDPRQPTGSALAPAREKALASPLFRGQLLSGDATTTLMMVRLEANRKNISQFEQPVAELRQLAADFNKTTSLHVEMTGIPPLRVEIFAAVQSENKKYTIIGSALAFLMGFILFRKLRLVMIASLAPVLAAFWTLGLMGLVGEKINVLNVVLPTLVIIVGFTSAIHLLVDARRSLAEGADIKRAVHASIAHLGGACTLAMFTTVVGFASLAASSAEILRKFGLVCAAGVVCSFVAVILLSPLLMLWLLRGDAAAAKKRTSAKLGALSQRLTTWITEHRRLVVALGCLATALPACLLPQLYPDSQLTETIPQERESYQTLKRCDAAFGGVLTVMVVVDWQDNLQLQSREVQAALADVETAILDTPPLHYPLSVRSILKTLHPDNPDSARALLELSVAMALAPEGTLSRMYNPAHPHRTIVTARLPDAGAAAYQEMFGRFDARLAQVSAEHPGITVRTTGTPKLAARNINQMVVDLTKSLTLAAIVIFGVIAIAFRSLRLGLISLIPNSFPLVLTGALLVVFNYPLQLASVIVFTICLGLAVDDTIHYLNRFRREMSRTSDVDLALRRASYAVGAALITSTLVLLAGFGSVTLSEIPTSRLFAGLACTAMAGALVGDLVFLPALISMFYRQRRDGQASEDVALTESE